MDELAADDLFGPGLDSLFCHLQALPDAKTLVGRRYPRLTGYHALEGGELIPTVGWPGQRPSSGFASRLGGGTIGPLTWALEGDADYDHLDDQDERLRNEHTPEELDRLRNEWPWAFPAGLLPRKYVSSHDDLSPDRYWRVGGGKPVAVYWILKLYGNPSNPGEQPCLWIKFTFGSFNDRLLQAFGFVFLSSERRTPLTSVTDSELQAHARVLNEKASIKFLLRHFKEIRELPLESQVVPRLKQVELVEFLKNPVGEPHAGLPVIVLDASGTPDRARTLAQLCLLALQNRRLSSNIHTAADKFLRSYLAKKLSKGRSSIRSFRDDREVDERVQDVLPTIIENYTGRDSSAYSFQDYVTRALKGLKPNRSSESAVQSKTGEAMSAFEVSKRAGVSRSYVYKSAAAKLLGEHRTRRRERRSPGGLRVEDTARQYGFSDNDIKTAADRVELKKRKAALVKLVAKRRKTTRRAAQRLVSARLKAGKSLLEIGAELLSGRT